MYEYMRDLGWGHLMRMKVGALLIAGLPGDRFGLDRKAGARPAQVQLPLKSEYDFRRISIQIQPIFWHMLHMYSFALHSTLLYSHSNDREWEGLRTLR